MKITITNQSISKSMIERAEIQWKWHFRKTKTVLQIAFGIALSFLFVGILLQEDYTMVSLSPKTKYYFNLHLMTSLGITGILVLLYISRLVFKSKKQLLESSQELARKFEDIHEITYEFNDTELIIDQNLRYEKFKWEMFSHKSNLESFITLHFLKSDPHGISIDSRMFSESELVAIMELIDRKIN